VKGNVVLSEIKHGEAVIWMDITCPWYWGYPFVSVMYSGGKGLLSQAVWLWVQL